MPTTNRNQKSVRHHLKITIMKKSLPYLLSFSFILLLASCLKEPEDEIVGCDPPYSSGAFRVVDKISGTDLFVGSKARYKLADVRIYPFHYRNEKDTLRLSVFSSATLSGFIFPLKVSGDTILVKIADLPMDTLIYTVKKPSNQCIPRTIDEAYVNNVAIIQDDNTLIFKK